MKLYAPEYYNKFKCIAYKCTHSCCIGWEIDVDGDTLSKYRGLSQGYGKNINESIETEEVPHFRLLAGDRCPHLDQNGLCRIITSLGEEYLCDICREHPRFYNDCGFHMEAGLGMACEEACRIILSSDGYDVLCPIGDTDGEVFPPLFDTVSVRERIYGILSGQGIGYSEKLKQIYGEFELSLKSVSDSEWRDVIDSLEYLDVSHKQLFSVYSSDVFPLPEFEKLLERALAYFIYRHCTEANDEEEYRQCLGFCLFCERLLASAVNNKECQSFEDFVLISRILSEEIEYSEDNTQTIKSIFAK